MNTKCTENLLCDALTERCQRMRPGGIKGIVKLEYVDKDLKNTGYTLAYYSGRSDKGLGFKFCPFCGFPFHEVYARGLRLG